MVIDLIKVNSPLKQSPGLYAYTQKLYAGYTQAIRRLYAGYTQAIHPIRLYAQGSARDAAADFAEVQEQAPGA